MHRLINCVVQSLASMHPYLSLIFAPTLSCIQTREMKYIERELHRTLFYPFQNKHQNHRHI